jgi:hypothetical protein
MKIRNFLKNDLKMIWKEENDKIIEDRFSNLKNDLKKIQFVKFYD